MADILNTEDVSGHVFFFLHCFLELTGYFVIISFLVIMRYFCAGLSLSD